MTTTHMSKHPCPQCGAPRSSTTAECPRCLLNLGLHMVSRDHEGGSREGSQASGSRTSRSRPAAPEPEELAERFPGLEIEREIGRGGMGVVYRARQRKLDRLVALKILSPELSGDPAFAERFLREARALGRLDHENIVAVHDFGETEGMCWLLMEFVDGVDLRRAMEAGELSPDQALAIVPQVCAALTAAHELGIVHRDIKPENVLLDGEGRVKIADFGLAKLVDGEPGAAALTRETQAMGTPHYMAPEQMKGAHDVDHRADIFSLGVVFYEMLTGQLPIGRFEAPSERVRVDVRLDEIVLRALESEPERRYQSAVEVSSAIEGMDSKPAAVRARPSRAALGERALRKRTWHARLIGGLFTLFLVVSPSVAGFFWGWGYVGLAICALLAVKAGLGVLHALALAQPPQEDEQRLPAWTILDQSVGSFLTAMMGVALVAIGVAARWETSTSHYASSIGIDAERSWSELMARERVRLFDGLGQVDLAFEFAPSGLVSSQSTGRLTDPGLLWWSLNGFVLLCVAAWLATRLASFRGWKNRTRAILAPAALTTLLVLHAGIGLSPFGQHMRAMTGLAGIVKLEADVDVLADVLVEDFRADGWEVLGKRVENWRDAASLDTALRHVQIDVRPKSLFERWDLTSDGPRRVKPEMHLVLTGPPGGAETGLSWSAGLLENGAPERAAWQEEIDARIAAAGERAASGD